MTFSVVTIGRSQDGRSAVWSTSVLRQIDQTELFGLVRLAPSWSLQTVLHVGNLLKSEADDAILLIHGYHGNTLGAFNNGIDRFPASIHSSLFSVSCS